MNLINNIFNQLDTSTLDIIYDEFVSILNVTNIKQFYTECKNKHLDIKNSRKGSTSSEGSRLNKDNFITIMFHVFFKDFQKREINITTSTYNINTSTSIISSPSKRDDSKDKIFHSICEKLFNRFKLVKCEIKSEKVKSLLNNNSEYFYVNDITNLNETPEIDTYELTSALCMFPKIDFKRKIKLLFEITDADIDGYINESEIKHMIFIVNFIFSDEEAPLKLSSSIINQSLANIKSNQMLNQIMKYPGELNNILSIEKYVDFNQFYEAISKIENFKYTIIPSFIDFKTCLSTKKIEPEFEMDKKNLKDFLQITNEIVSNVKMTNNEINKNPNIQKDIKKLLENNIQKVEKLTKKKRNFLEENINKINHRVLKYETEEENLTIEMNNFNTKTNTMNNLPIINSRSNQNKNNKFYTSSNNVREFHANNLNSNPSESYNIYLNKISNLETQPGKIKIKENVSLPNSNHITIAKDNNMSSINKTETTFVGEKDSKDVYRNTLTKMQLSSRLNNETKKTYISFNEIINEIQILSNKKDYANFEDTEEIKKLINSAKNTAFRLKNNLRDTGTTKSLNFANFKYKKGNVN